MFKIFFPSKGTIFWRKDVPALCQINEYIAKMGENYASVMDNYFYAFKEKMNKKFRIPKNLIDDYKDDVYFMVDSDKVYIQVVRLRIVLVKHPGYEVNIDETKDIIEVFIDVPIDPKEA